MKRDSEIAEAVGRVHEWIDSELAGEKASCKACGKCCDFDGFGHRLFVTKPEMIYLRVKLSDNTQPMKTARCPYNVDAECQIHRHRFAGCRIFFCGGDADMQSRLTEAALVRFKSIGSEFGLDYEYADLRTALNRSTSRESS